MAPTLENCFTDPGFFKASKYDWSPKLTKSVSDWSPKRNPHPTARARVLGQTSARAAPAGGPPPPVCAAMLVLSLRAALIKKLLLAHRLAPPEDLVDMVMGYAAPRVELLRAAFDDFLAEFMDAPDIITESLCCCVRRTKEYPHDRFVIRINDKDSQAVYNHPYRYFLAANRSLTWFRDVIEGHETLFKRSKRNNSTLKTYLRVPREPNCPKRCYCCTLIHMENVNSFYWAKKLRCSLLKNW